MPEAEGHTSGGASGKPSLDPAQSKTLYMRGNSLHGNREILPTPAADSATGRPEKVYDRTSGMHVGGKSDDCIVPKKPPNKDRTSAEAVEGRRSTEGKPSSRGPCPGHRAGPARRPCCSGCVELPVETCLDMRFYARNPK